MLERYAGYGRNMCSSSSTATSILSADEVMLVTEPIMHRLVSEQYVTGLIAAFVADGKTSFKSFGTFSTGVAPVTEAQSKLLTFEIGSISKPLTGMALASLVDSAHLQYSTTLHDAIPEIKSEAQAASRTMLQLATHSSGLPRLPTDLVSRGPASDPYSKYTKNDVIANLNILDDLKAPGTVYEYSNLGYGALGLSLVSKSGKASYDQLMRERVFDPLRMEKTSTTLRLTTTGHDESLIPVQPWTFSGLEACGALRSNSTDMMNLLKAMADPSSCGSDMEKVINASLSPVITEPHTMGLGWVVGLEGDQDMVWHNGSTAGYHSFIGVHRPSKRGVLLLSNTANSIVSTVGSHLLSTLIGKPSSPSFHEFYSEEIPPELVSEFAGLYRYKNAHQFIVKTRGSHVFIKLPKQADFVRAFPETPFKFHIRNTGATIEFDGIHWETRRPPHTLTYTHGTSTFEATRDGQEVRKFFFNAKRWFSPKRKTASSTPTPSEAEVKDTHTQSK